MNYQTSQSKGDRFMKGWQTLFSKSQQTGKKPFPKDRFFSPEELEFLDTTQSELSLLEKWALQLGKWARDKSETSHFPQVKWQAGRFSTWVDNIEEIDSKNKQIERFRQLKADGYVLPSAYESMIEDKLGKDLVGMFFKQGHGNKERICTVDAYIGGNSAGESHIAYSTFLSPSTQPELHEIPLARFQQLIQSKELVQLTPEETKSWVKGREQVEAARKDFMALQKDIGKTYPLNFGGDFPAVSHKQIFSQFLQKNITPLSWSLNAKDDMKVNFYVNDRWEKVQQLDITPLNAHQHMELLRAVKTQLESDNLNAHLEKLMSCLGNKIGDSILFIPTSPGGISTTEDHADGVLLSNSGKLSAFKRPKNVEIPLNTDDLKLIKEGLIKEGVTKIALLQSKSPEETEQLAQLTKELTMILGSKQAFNQHLSHVLSSPEPSQKEFKEASKEDHVNDQQEVALMKDYVQSMKDANNPFSGDMMLLPDDTEIKTLFQEQEMLEDDYERNVSSMDLKARNQMEVQIQKSVDHYEKKLSSLIGDYFSQEKLQQKKNAPENEEKVYMSSEDGFFEPIKGRWHTEEHLHTQAYSQYGKLIADRLSLQVTYPELPWIKSNAALPQGINGDKFDSKTSLLLSILTEKEGYEVPIYMTLDDIKRENLKVDISKEGFCLSDGKTLQTVYNIEQTNFSMEHPQKWEQLRKSCKVSASKQTSVIGMLTEKGKYPAQVIFDGRKGLVSYSAKEDAIHLAPHQLFESEDDYMRDLSIGLVRSTRKEAAKLTRYEHLVKEELLAHIGGAMIGQRCKFDVKGLDYNKYWKDLLKQDPGFTKHALTSAEHAVNIIFQYVEKANQAESPDKGIDLRTSTPIDMDVDGNGMIESQENMAADTKQGENEQAHDHKEDTMLPHASKSKCSR